MFFDYSVTLSREVELFWCGRTMNGATVLFLANRYLTLVYYGFNTVVEFMLPDLSSAKVSIQALAIVSCESTTTNCGGIDVR